MKFGCCPQRVRSLEEAAIVAKTNRDYLVVSLPRKRGHRKHKVNPASGETICGQIITEEAIVRPGDCDEDDHLCPICFGR